MVVAIAFLGSLCVAFSVALYFMVRLAIQQEHHIRDAQQYIGALQQEVKDFKAREGTMEALYTDYCKFLVNRDKEPTTSHEAFKKQYGSGQDGGAGGLWPTSKEVGDAAAIIKHLQREFLNTYDKLRAARDIEATDGDTEMSMRLDALAKECLALAGIQWPPKGAGAGPVKEVNPVTSEETDAWHGIPL